MHVIIIIMVHITLKTRFSIANRGNMKRTDIVNGVEFVLSTSIESNS